MNLLPNNSAMRRSLLGLAGSSLLLLVGTAPAAADGTKELRDSNIAVESSFMVDNSGELVRVVSGTYGEIFTEGGEAAVDAEVLVLEKVIGDRTEQFLVPGTESLWPESSARLIADERAGVKYLLWESRVNGVHPQLNLVAFDGSSWGEVKEITAGVFASKGEPQLHVTHDTYFDQVVAESADGSTENTVDNVERTVLHVSWWEQVGHSKEKRYAFLAMENGEFIDTYKVIDLTALPGQGAPSDNGDAVESLIRMQTGSHQDMVVMGYWDPSTEQLVGVQVEVLPQALSRLSDQLKVELAALPELTSETAGEAIQRALSSVEHDFHEVTLELIRQNLMDFLETLSAGNNAGGPFLDKMGARVIWIGAKFGRGGLAVQGEQELVEIADPRQEHFSHHLAFTRIASWDAPETGDSPKLFLSRNGSEAVLAWLGTEGTVEFRETTAGQWGEVQVLHLPEGVAPAQALEWLERKALDR